MTWNGALPDSVKKLIEAKVYANVVTLMKDGSPMSRRCGSTATETHLDQH